MTNNQFLKVTKLGKGNWNISGPESEIEKLTEVCLKKDIEITKKSSTEILVTDYDTYRKLKSLNIL